MTCPRRRARHAEHVNIFLQHNILRLLQSVLLYTPLVNGAAAVRLLSVDHRSRRAELGVRALGPRRPHIVGKDHEVDTVQPRRRRSRPLNFLSCEFLGLPG